MKQGDYVSYVFDSIRIREDKTKVITIRAFGIIKKTFKTFCFVEIRTQSGLLEIRKVPNHKIFPSHSNPQTQEHMEAAYA